MPALTHSQRLQEYGVGIFELIPTKSALKKAIKKECILVNNTIATTATIIRGGETISFSIDAYTKDNQNNVLALSVLYEDDHLAVINKPAGILVSGNNFKTIANALPYNLLQSALEDQIRPQPAHRLDFATTGALLVGKTAQSLRMLNKMFQDKQIDKTYFAVTIGTMKSQGIIQSEIDGKDAITHFECLKTVSSARFGFLNLVKLSPKTGRRHQIRKHLAGQRNPILGDRDYSPSDLLLTGKGMYLHAYSLIFLHPITKKQIEIMAPLPKRFTRFLMNKLSKSP